MATYAKKAPKNPGSYLTSLLRYTRHPKLCFLSTTDSYQKVENVVHEMTVIRNVFKLCHDYTDDVIMNY